MNVTAIGAQQESSHPFVFGQLSVIREMLTTLDTLTTAGQHHVICKVLAFIQGRVQDASPRVSRRNQATLAELMERLRHESGRLLPDPVSFSRHAEALMSLIGAAA